MRLPPPPNSQHGTPIEGARRDARQASHAGVLSPRAARLRAALTDTVAEHGYTATTIQDIVTRAGVSRRFFDLEYTTKERCLTAAFDCFSQQIYARLVSAYRRNPDHATDPAAALRASIQTLMHTIATRPAHSWLCVVEARSAGPTAADHSYAAETYLAHILQTGLPNSEEHPIVQGMPAAIIGGIWHVIHHHLTAHTALRLPELTDEIVRWALSYTHLGPHASDGETGAALVPHENTTPTLEGGPIPSADDKHDRILTATATTIGCHGYRNTRVRDIAEHLGISTSTFYRYFSSKNNAVLAVCQQLSRHMTKAAATAYAAGSSPAIGIREAITSLINSLEENPNAAYLLMVDSLQLGSPARHIHDQAIQSLANLYSIAFDAPATNTCLQATTGAVWSTLRTYIRHIHDQPELGLSGDELIFIALAPCVGRESATTIAWEAPQGRDPE
jgi:AcrR family transcriptional regulator